MSAPRSARFRRFFFIGDGAAPPRKALPRDARRGARATRVSPVARAPARLRAAPNRTRPRLGRFARARPSRLRRGRRSRDRFSAVSGPPASEDGSRRTPRIMRDCSLPPPSAPRRARRGQAAIAHYPRRPARAVLARGRAGDCGKAISRPATAPEAGRSSPRETTEPGARSVRRRSKTRRCPRDGRDARRASAPTRVPGKGLPRRRSAIADKKKSPEPRAPRGTHEDFCSLAATLEAFTCAVARTVVWAAMANMASGGFRALGTGVCAAMPG